MKKAVIAVVGTRAEAEALASNLLEAGFGTKDISALFPDERSTKGFSHEQHTKAPEGAATGAGTGGVVGGVLGLLAGIGALAIPGLGPFIAAGPIMAALSGAAVVGAVGGVAGALIGMGIPEYEAKVYEGRLRTGNVLLSVHTDNAEDRKRALDVFRKAGVRDVATQSEAAVPHHDRTSTR